MTKTSTTRYYIQDSVLPIFAYTKCAPELREDLDQVTIALCENPGLNNGIDSQVPVTGQDGKTTYRNAYCAKCYDDNKVSDYIYWDLSINCDYKITFNKENILDVFEENACEVYLTLPGLVSTVEPCNALQEYTISACNVTGLWTHYNRSTELACHSFTDPFNQTYRNYFCYLCNTDDPIQRDKRTCATHNSRQSSLDAPFASTVTYDMVMQISTDLPLNCQPEKQFTDAKKVLCTILL